MKIMLLVLKILR